MPDRTPITITWDDLSSPSVDQALRESNRPGVARGTSSDPRPRVDDVAASGLARVWRHAVIYMSAFGLLGGLLAAMAGQFVLPRTDRRAQAVELRDSHRRLLEAFSEGRLTQDQFTAAEQRLQRSASGNPYLSLTGRDDLSDAQRIEHQRQFLSRDRIKRRIADALFYGGCGMLIAALLAAAEPLVARNLPKALSLGTIGAVVGLLGGVIVSLFADALYQHLGGGGTEVRRQLLARSLGWGVLGLFLAISPGLAMLNPKRLLIGAAGGVVGGLIGGLLFDPVGAITGSGLLSRLVALGAIGLIAGAGTGAIETAVRSGWLQVTGGLIAGKQFILYRRATYLGSSPQCDVYLFKDPAVGRRHAVIHLTPAGYQIENLPFGEATRVNALAIERTRLRSGDQIQIGTTRFTFMERSRSRDER